MSTRQIILTALLVIISVRINDIYACGTGGGGGGGGGIYEPTCDSAPGDWYNLNYYGFPGFSCPANCTAATTGAWMDACGNRYFEITCQSTPFYNGCAYEFWCWADGHSPKRVGLCVYGCGINSFWIRFNATTDRFLEAKHRTHDGLSSECDEGTIGKYDWQITHYYYDTDALQGWCREGDSLDWIESNNSVCENHWW